MLLIASKRLLYGGKAYNAGEQFNATKEHAGLLTTLKFAQYPPEPSSSVKETFHTVSLVKSNTEVSGDLSLPKIKRKYKRRDKVADDHAEAIADDNGMAIEPKKPKRQYRRRDMVAEVENKSE